VLFCSDGHGIEARTIQQIELAFLETNFAIPVGRTTGLLLEKMRKEEENHEKGPRRSWA
jgi:hypothetical protein